MWYVNITGIHKNYLEFIGYDCVLSGDEFEVFRHYRGEEFIVDISNPYLMVEDFNDATLLRRQSKRDGLIKAPPKVREDN